MSGYKDLDHQQRQKLAMEAKKAMLEKHRAAVEDPTLAERQATRLAIHEAREARIAEREAAKKKRQAELAAQAEADRLAAITATEEAERELALAAEKKAERDARYAARKAAKKQRRKG